MGLYDYLVEKITGKSELDKSFDEAADDWYKLTGEGGKSEAGIQSNIVRTKDGRILDNTPYGSNTNRTNAIGLKIIPDVEMNIRDNRMRNNELADYRNLGEYVRSSDNQLSELGNISNRMDSKDDRYYLQKASNPEHINVAKPEEKYKDGSFYGYYDPEQKGLVRINEDKIRQHYKKSPYDVEDIISGVKQHEFTHAAGDLSEGYEYYDMLPHELKGATPEMNRAAKLRALEALMKDKE